MNADTTPDATDPSSSSASSPTPGRRSSGRDAAGWSSDRGRALLLPLGGMIAVVLMVGMSMIWPVDAQVVTAAVTATITLAAAAGGHAAGAASRRD